MSATNEIETPEVETPETLSSVLSAAEVGHKAILKDDRLVHIQGLRRCALSGNAIMTTGGQWIPEDKVESVTAPAIEIQE